MPKQHQQKTNKQTNKQTNRQAILSNFFRAELPCSIHADTFQKLFAEGALDRTNTIEMAYNQ